MIKIGYVINNLQIGGAEILLLNFIRSLDKKKYRVYVYTLFERNPLKVEFIKSGATIRELRMKNNRQFWKIWQLYEHMVKDKLDIVHTHLCDADLYGRTAARLAKIGIIISTEHSITPWKLSKDLKRRIRTKIDLYTAKFCDVVICISKAVADFHIKWGIPKKKIRIIYPSTFLTSICGTKISIRKKLGIPPANTFITTIGRLVPEKGQATLLHSAFDVLKYNQQIIFIVLGDGPLKEDLITLAQTSKYSKNIMFLGTREDVREILHISDILVVPSLHEGFGITIVEAMQQGLPIIASNVGGIPEIVDSNTGILIPPSNVDELTKAILALHNNKGLRRKLGHKGRVKVGKRFSFANFVSQTLSLYNELMTTP